MEQSVRVVARLRAKEGKEEELKQLLLGLIEPTQQEEGAIHYTLMENTEDSTEFTFVEEWLDEKSLQNHLSAPHIQDAIEHFPDVLAKDMDLRTYNLIGGK